MCYGYTVNKIEDFPKDSGVYMIRNTINGHFYIGSSVDMRNRVLKHRNELRGGKHANPRLQKAWIKYGEDAFGFEILEWTSREGTWQIEDEWLSSTVGLPECYNIAIYPSNPNQGRKLTDSHKNKIGIANHLAMIRKGNPTPQIPENRRYRRIKGTYVTSESTKQKQRITKLGKSAPWNAKTKTDAVKRKVSETKLGIKFTDEQWAFYRNLSHKRRITYIKKLKREKT